jgi:hypothetical protein
MINPVKEAIWLLLQIIELPKLEQVPAYTLNLTSLGLSIEPLFDKFNKVTMCFVAVAVNLNQTSFTVAPLQLNGGDVVVAYRSVPGTTKSQLILLFTGTVIAPLHSSFGGISANFRHIVKVKDELLLKEKGGYILK